MSTNSINLDALPYESFAPLFLADMKMIGTAAYIGLGVYWHGEYKFALRDASIAKRRKVHHAFLKAGLAVDGASPAHAAIVYRHLPR
jgi:hypothetical protein